jgi:SAM-dependent methyltransferase
MNNLQNLISRKLPPVPWEEGDNIPWNEPSFSKSMLKEHLSQEHDAASRRFGIVDKHVGWIDRDLLSKGPSQVLDLGCGPGLYTLRLARLGHKCIGIDYSPASIAYAKDQSRDARVSIEYRCEDIRSTDFTTSLDLVMLIYGELNVFRPEDAKTILKKARRSLHPGGRLLLECHTFSAVRSRGLESASWQSLETGLFSQRPHILLQESFWDVRKRTATTRYFVIESGTDSVGRYASTMQAYTDEDYADLLAECGFGSIEKFPSLTGTEEDRRRDLFVIVAG